MHIVSGERTYYHSRVRKFESHPRTAVLGKFLEDGVGCLQPLFELATLVEVEELLEEAGLARWEHLFVCEGLGHYYRV